jgi:seryl-tRNA synthetase
MTLQEILKSKGLSDEQIEAILGEMKQNKIFTANEENLDIRYGKLKGDHENLTKQHSEATALIEQLKKDNKGNEDLQSKVTGYETRIGELEKELEQSKVDSALKIALLEAKVQDVDYLTFKIKEKGEVILDENGKIKGIDDTLAALKTQYPNQFVTDANNLEIQPQPLPNNNGNRDVEPTSLADAIKQTYDNNQNQ